MTIAREPITGISTPFPKDYSTGKMPSSKDCPAPLHRDADIGNRASKWAGSGRPALQGCACAETKDLPDIILVSSGADLMPGLRQALDPCPLEIRTVKSCLEAGREIGNCTTAHVILTDVRLPDGDWKQVLQMARQSAARAEVIVVSKVADVPLYLDALEAGAFDFVVPPFRAVEIGFVIVNAMYACFKQRAHRLSGNFRDATAV